MHCKRFFQMFHPLRDMPQNLSKTLKQDRKPVFVRLLALGAALFLLPAVPWAQEDPGIVEHETGIYYTVKKGDTLWDISQKFNDSAWQWPDLWQENKQIPNPHQIYPGERIRLYRKKGAQAMVKKEAPPPVKVETVEEPKMVEEQPVMKTPAAPEPEKAAYLFSQIDGIGFIRKVPVDPLGKLFKVKDDKELISQGDLLYIHPLGGAQLNPGGRYTIYRTFDPIKGEGRHDIIGTQHYITGIVEIIKKEPSFVVGSVVKSFRSIKVDDLIMPYKRRSPRITLTDSPKGLRGSVIMSEENTEMFAGYQIAFLDRGENDGVKTGQYYNVYSQERRKTNPKMKEGVLLPPIEYAKLLVVHTEKTTATVLVTQSDRSIAPGATFFSPPEE